MNQRTVALDEATYSRLLTCRATMEIAVQRNPHQYPLWMHHGRLSLDKVVSFLLDHRDNDLRRKRDHDERRKAKTQAVYLDPSAPWDEDKVVTIPPGAPAPDRFPPDPPLTASDSPPDGEY